MDHMRISGIEPKFNLSLTKLFEKHAYVQGNAN